MNQYAVYDVIDDNIEPTFVKVGIFIVLIFLILKLDELEGEKGITGRS